jgi:hypothetical protein
MLLIRLINRYLNHDTITEQNMGLFQELFTNSISFIVKNLCNIIFCYYII